MTFDSLLDASRDSGGGGETKTAAKSKEPENTVSGQKVATKKKQKKVLTPEKAKI